MSFPPRHPMGMPPMGPGMGYAFAPMGMMPMGMGMMAPPPQMMRPMMPSTAPAKPPVKKLVPQEIQKDEKKEDKPPVTTVFVGNISEKAPDMMIKQMLQRCGNVLSWKRVQGASGKLQAFGFCEYEYPEATLRCIRLLNEWNICDKKLVVKVDAKTKTLLDEYKSKKDEEEKKKEKVEEETTEKKEKSESENEEKDKDKEQEKEKEKEKENGEESSEKEEVDEMSQREDRVARAGLEAIMREYAMELNKPGINDLETKEKAPVPKKKIEESSLKDQGLDDLEMEEDKKHLINREIRFFRDRHKGEEEKEESLEEKERRYEEKRRRQEQMKERERLREREKVILRERTKTRSRSRTRSMSPRRRRRSRSKERSRDRSRERRRERETEEEEEAYERRKAEKKLREKEAAYKERLNNWEARERKKSREYDKEKEREEERKQDEQREARRLKEFLEDYDDLRDDPKYFKGSALARRLKEREKEKEADSRDRQREKEEFEELKRKLMDEGHPDPEAELARVRKMEKEKEEHLRPKFVLPEIEPVTVAVAVPEPTKEESSEEEEEEELPKISKMQPTLKPVQSNSVSSHSSPSTDGGESSRSLPGVPEIAEPVSQPVIIGPAMKEESAKIGFNSIKFGTSSSNSPAETSGPKRKKYTIGDVFNQDDDESAESKKRKLIPLDYDEKKNEKKATTAEEKRMKIKNLIEGIPTAKEELFQFPLDWSIVDQTLMDKRIKPWVIKKIVEYIGEEEPALTEFICQKVAARSSPQSILNDLVRVIDDAAEVFVVKMWRLLVYETEAKKLGLVK